MAEQAEIIQQLKDQQKASREALNAKDILNAIIEAGKGEFINGTFTLKN